MSLSKLPLLFQTEEKPSRNLIIAGGILAVSVLAMIAGMCPQVYLLTFEALCKRIANRIRYGTTIELNLRHDRIATSE